MKKAILIVSNGTSDIAALEASIMKFEDRVRNEFKEYEVFRAFFSEKIISKLKSKYNFKVDTPLEALIEIEKLGFEDLVIQPLYIVCGVEYKLLENAVDEFKKKSKLRKIILGNPALIENDKARTFDFMNSIKDNFQVNKAIVVAVHGTKTSANKCYLELNDAFRSCGLSKVFVGAVEGEPSFDWVLTSLKNNNIKEVLLMPFLIVAGFHAKKDLVSQSPKSWKSILEREEIHVEEKLIGLGEMIGFQEFFLRDLRELIDNI